MKSSVLILFISLLPCLALAQEGSLDEAFSQPAHTTDQQNADALEFVHQARGDRIAEEGCAERLNGNCNVSQIDSQGMVLRGTLGPVLEQNIGKLYTTLFGGTALLTGGGTPKLNAYPEAPAEGEVATSSDANSQVNDPCLYAAVGYELLGGFMQQSAQQEIQANNASMSDTQLRALVSLREAHRERARTATWQAGVYTATTACYAAMALNPRVVTNLGDSRSLGYYLKLSASGGLATLFWLKRSKHLQAKDAVQAIIDDLPKAGDCNPWTGTACFCSEPTSQTAYANHYQQVCVLNAGNFDVPKTALGCGVMQNNQITFDRECQCKQTNKCFRVNVRSSTPQLSMGSNLMNEANKGFDLLSGGDYDQGKLDQYVLSNAALVARARKRFPINGVPKLNLTAEEKEIAESLDGIVPPGMAGMVARNNIGAPPGGAPPTAATPALGLDNLPPAIKDKIAAIDGGYKKKGAGFRGNNAKEPGFVLPTFGAKPAPKEQGPEILSFAEQAVENADVSNAPQTPIFDIISNRYRRSAWGKFELKE